MDKPKTSEEIRQAFLDFFADNGHTIVPSSSLVPLGDPSLLFTNAGMVPFKDVFLGLEQRPYKRATSSQKCMRVSGKHNDLEEVGPSPRHQTFFEMLGNFSFGNYFKEAAIPLAYACLTEVFGIPPDRLVYTVHQDDSRAYDIWIHQVGVPPERVYRMGDKTNFWMMGDTGPCGPTSELHYDFGPEACTCGEPDCSVALDNGCGRWLEVWNLVFMQYNQAADGTRTLLPKPGVDTGMGLERLVSILQDKSSNYETDLFAPILRRTQQLLGDSDEEVQRKSVGYRVIADHSRAITFLIGDGVLPGNEGRRYVLRLILRRAARYGKIIGFDRPFLADIAEAVIEKMGPVYDDLLRRREFILRTIRHEEERFQETLSVGLGLMDEIMADLRRAGKSEIPGGDAFRLYDTYGFPVDLTRDVAAEHGFAVDEAGFRAAMEEQRQRARQATHFTGRGEALGVYQQVLADLQESGDLDEEGVRYDPYGPLRVETRLLALLRDGQRLASARAGDKVELVLADSPFYIESGGQVSDTGMVTHYSPPSGGEAPPEPGWTVSIQETRRAVPGLMVLSGEVVQGSPREGDPALAEVDRERRADIMRNHTATHVLHRALRHTLGEHVHQAGSLVAPDRLRFDFTHSDAVSPQQLREIEDEVNEAVLSNLPVHVIFTRYKQAVREGAMALFDEKYGEVVRTIRIGDPQHPFSYELCGGTHLSETAEIGLFHIVSEGSIGSGVRRVEAVTGRGAQRLVEDRLFRLDTTAAVLNVSPEDIEQRVRALMEENQQTRKELAQLQRELARRDLETLMSHLPAVDGVPVLAARVQASDIDLLREMTDWFRSRVGSGVIVLGTVLNGRPNVIAAVTPDLVSRGIDANQLVKEIARYIGGGGGGKPTLAQAGGRDADRLDEALGHVPEAITRNLKG